MHQDRRNVLKSNEVNPRPTRLHRSSPAGSQQSGLAPQDVHSRPLREVRPDPYNRRVMTDACTVILQDRSYCVDGRFAAVIRHAVQSGALSVDIEAPCPCGATSGHQKKMNLALADIVNVIHHGARPFEDTEPQIRHHDNVIVMRRR